MLKLKHQYFGHWCKEWSHWKRPWCWERLKAGGEGDDREWDGWMASLTRLTWVWASPRSWWTGKSGVLQSMGSQSDMTEQLNWQKIEIVKQKRYQLKQKELKIQCTSLVSILQVWVLRLIWGRILNWQGRVCLVFWVLFSWWYICSITLAYNHYLWKCIQCCVFKDKQ